jgi:hypothetical protein
MHKQTIRANMTYDVLNEWRTTYTIEEKEKTKALMEDLRLKGWPEFPVIERPERNLQFSRRLMPSWPGSTLQC